MKACMVAFLLSLSSLSAPAIAQAMPQPDTPDLQATIAGLDAALFDAFNRCADPTQLAVHAGYFDPAVEFYHDTGGVTWNREDMLANTRRHACGRPDGRVTYEYRIGLNPHVRIVALQAGCVPPMRCRTPSVEQTSAG